MSVRLVRADAVSGQGHEHVRAVRRRDRIGHEALVGAMAAASASATSCGIAVRRGLLVRTRQVEPGVLRLEVDVAAGQRLVAHLAVGDLELAGDRVARALQNLGVHLGDQLVLGERTGDTPMVSSALGSDAGVGRSAAGRRPHPSRCTRTRRAPAPTGPPRGRTCGASAWVYPSDRTSWGRPSPPQDVNRDPIKRVFATLLPNAAAPRRSSQPLIEGSPAPSIGPGGRPRRSRTSGRQSRREELGQ